MIPEVSDSVKSAIVVPAHAGTQCRSRKTLDSRLRGNDGTLLTTVTHLGKDQ